MKEWHAMTDNGRLPAKQEALLLALVSGERLEAAAKTANISPRTAYRWQKESSFQAAMKKAQDEAFVKKLSLLKDGFGAALSTLARNMRDPAPAGVQVAAARCWIENAITIHKTEELEDALAEVQALLKEGDRYVPL